MIKYKKFDKRSLFVWLFTMVNFIAKVSFNFSFLFLFKIAGLIQNLSLHLNESSKFQTFLFK